METVVATRLTRLAGLLRIVVWIAIALLVVLPSVSWLDVVPGRALFGARVAPGDIAFGQRLAGWALVMVPYAILAFGLAQLLRFCRVVQARRPFTGAAAAALHRFGWCLITASLAFPAARLAAALVAAPPMPPGELFAAAVAGPVVLFSLAFGVTFGLVLVVFAALLREAARLAEENAGFV